MAGVKPFSPFVWEILLELQHPQASALSVGRKISFDPALSALLFRACCSAAYGIQQEIKSPVHAVSLLGLEKTRQLILSWSAKSLVESQCTQGRLLWEHIMRVTFAARNLAWLRMENLDSAELFTASLLHDLGKMFLLDQLGQEECFGGDRKERLFRERELVGKDHSELSYEILRDWPLSESIKEAVRRHHEPPEKAPPLVRLMAWAHDFVYKGTLPPEILPPEKQERLREMVQRDLEGLEIFYE